MTCPVRRARRAARGHPGESRIEPLEVRLLPAAAPVDVSLTVLQPLAIEGGIAARLRFETAVETHKSVKFKLAVAGTAAPADYLPLPKKIVLKRGQPLEIDVHAVDDAAIEPDKTLIVSVAASKKVRALAESASATITIVDNDAPPAPVPTVTVQTTFGPAREAGPAAGTFTVTRSNAGLEQPLTVKIAWQGTAANGVDYELLPNELVIPAGETSISVVLVPIRDAVVEGTETAVLALQPDPAYQLGAAKSAAMQITDQPVVSIFALFPTAFESGGTPGRFRISRQGSTADVLIVPLTIGGTAASGADYEALPAFVVFGIGQSSLLVDVVPIADDEAEPPETVEVTLSESPNYGVGANGSATVMLLDPG